ncbi:acetyltransferase [Sulfurimonas sp.]|uniref:acetyltransferase n=1 Tax=Sulfurimonas sp. TaxID=2022749 RepID=UPI00286D7C6F|nr:acetyltransferase [Sulfurimonas sp.]
MKSIYIYGSSGHGLVVADIAKACGYEDVIFIDDGDNEYPTFEEIQKNKNISIAFGIGTNSVRAKLFDKVKNSGFEIATLIHPSAVISPSVTIGVGTVVMPNVVANAKAIVGDGVILNSGCIVEHECVIEDFVHISPNAALAGAVKVGEFTHIGIGSNVIQGISIGKNTIIGAGSVVIKSISDFKKAYGNPCREIEDMNL